MNFVASTIFTILLLCVVARSNDILVAGDDGGGPEPTKCGRNEEYTTCIQCPQTCKDLIPGVCTPAPCVKGCKCRTGLFRDKEGKCVSIVACIIENIKDRVPGIGP